MLLAFIFALFVPAAAAADLEVAWDYGGIPAGMSLFELKPGDWEVATTSVAASIDGAPVTTEIPGATVRLEPGQTHRIALVYRNATKEPVRFFAAPHSVTPAQASLGFKFRCLCVNKVFVVPPGGAWYRVVELRLARDFKGQRLKIVHQLLAQEEVP